MHAGLLLVAACHRTRGSERGGTIRGRHSGYYLHLPRPHSPVGGPEECRAAAGELPAAAETTVGTRGNGAMVTGPTMGTLTVATHQLPISIYPTLNGTAHGTRRHTVGTTMGRPVCRDPRPQMLCNAVDAAVSGLRQQLSLDLPCHELREHVRPADVSGQPALRKMSARENNRGCLS